MKIIKHFITLAILSICFVLSAELYQTHLFRFTNGFYYIEIDYQNRNQMYEAITEAAIHFDESVFAVKREDINPMHATLNIYTLESTIEVLKSKSDIGEGFVESFFSGATEIQFVSFEDMIQEDDVTRFYFSGDKDTVIEIRTYINKIVPTSYVHIEVTQGTENLIYIIWAVAFLFILMLTWLDIQFAKKQTFLKISMGGSIERMVLQNVVIDLVVDIVGYLALYYLLKAQIYVEFRHVNQVLLFILFCVFNSALYLSLFKVDYKEVMYGANLNDKLLSKSYVIKTFVMMMLIVALSCNVKLIFEGIETSKAYEQLENVRGYKVISGLSADKETSLFLKAFQQNNVFLSLCVAELDKPIIIINEAARTKVLSDPSQIQKSDKDFVVYVPKGSSYSDYDLTFAAGTTAKNLFGIESCSYEVKEYQSEQVMYFDFDDGSKLQYGFERIYNPVIVYCNVSANTLQNLLDNNMQVEYSSDWINIGFQIQDVQDIDLSLQSDVGDIEYTEIVEICSQQKNSMFRLLIMNSVVSIFLIGLCLLLNSAIVKIEYLINAKDVAIKRILGYSIVQRNASVFGLNFFTIIIAFVTGLFITLVYKIYSIQSLGMVALFVLLFDGCLILLNMVMAEHKNTAHTLKGGSL